MDERTKKILIMGIILLIIWMSFLIFLIKYKDKLQENPCEICAKRMGEDVKCFVGIQQITFNWEEEVNDEQEG